MKLFNNKEIQCDKKAKKLFNDFFFEEKVRTDDSFIEYYKKKMER